MCFTYKNSQETRKKIFFICSTNMYIEYIWKSFMSALDFEYPQLSEKMIFVARFSSSSTPQVFLEAERRVCAQLFSEHS